MERSRWTTPRHAFRKRYGDAIADIVEMHSSRFAQRVNRPGPQDVKAALQAILADPEAVDVQRVDALTRTLLMDPAWRRLRVQSLHSLTREQLHECAKYALDHFPPLRKPMIERAEVLMALSLLAAAADWHAARRNNLLREALSLVFQAEYRRATAIIKKAHRELRATTWRRSEENRSSEVDPGLASSVADRPLGGDVDRVGYSACSFGLPIG